MNTAAPEQLQRQQQMMSLLNQQNQHTQEDARTQPGATPGFFALDPSSAAKQMAALSATAQNRRASQSGGTSDTLFGPRQTTLDAVAQTIRGPAPSAQVHKSRRDDFLKFVANVMNARHTPLPATITGIPSAYDPATSRWKTIEPTAEPGGFRLAGKDVDLFKLWQVVLSLGGNAKVTRESSWNVVLAQLGLPEEIPDAQTNGTTSVARVLGHYYMAILAPFEEVYLRNMQQQKAIQARNQQLQQQGHASSIIPDASSTGPPSHPSQNPLHGITMSTSMPHVTQQPNANGVEPEHLPISPPSLDTTMLGQHRPQTPPLSQTSTPVPQGSGSDIMHGAGNEHRDRSEPVGSPGFQGNAAEEDGETRKRKFFEDEMGKRARQRTDPSAIGQDIDNILEVARSGSQTRSPPQLASHAQVSSPAQPSSFNPSHSSRQVCMRRKVEYVPLARELNTHGGRDLNMIDAEIGKLSARRPQRSIDEWGTVDIEGLTMSIRSRLPTEISYALTVLTVLSTMRGQTPDTGFSLQQCDDLLDELLDLLREHAFGDHDDENEDVESEKFWTHRELITLVRDDGFQTFSHLPPTKGYVTTKGDFHPSSASIVSAILNMFRNFSLVGENQRFIAHHPDALALLLRICSLSTPSLEAPARLPSPSSPALTLSEAVKARRDILTIISNLVSFVNLSSHPPHISTRIFALLASFLVEPHELSSPSGIFIQSGSNVASVRPPLVVDLALEAFSKLTQPDTNRLAMSRGIKNSWLWTLFGSLVHRLPVSSEDFTITMRMHDVWLSYLEKVVLSIYSICFLASPELKARIKADRPLAFSRLILRMVKKFVSITHPDARQYFLVSSRRAVEALKLIDDGGDAFESPQSTAPQLAFGMGFGESDAKQIETGVGLLAGFQEDVTLSIMMMPHLDEVMFTELDSLSRIGT